ncbi:MAG: hypothetical protein FWF29_05450, partial [Treponema sp.]|nr:hypothetical protein [Treponema sp.]
MKETLPGEEKQRLPLLSRGSGKIIGTSLAAALIGWLLLSALNIFIFWALRDRARLIRDNDNERTISILFNEMRNNNDLGAAIESNPALLERIKGAAIYESNLQPLQQWGKVPPVFNEEILKNLPINPFGRYTIPDRQGRSAKFVLRFERQRQQEQSRQTGVRQDRPLIGRQESAAQGEARTRRSDDDRSGGDHDLLFSGLPRGRYFYTEISHPGYWRTLSVTTLLFPLAELILLFLVLYIRLLYLRNREYREKIETQQNLVVLGAAAGTLAHEIKNPLLSIRLQTGILEKTGGGTESSEINIINQEVDRLSSLVYRVNDYLREPAGLREPLDISALTEETARRICGIDTSSAPQAIIYADEACIRSVLENVLRNAM